MLSFTLSNYTNLDAVDTTADYDFINSPKQVLVLVDENILTTGTAKHLIKLESITATEAQLLDDLLFSFPLSYATNYIDVVMKVELCPNGNTYYEQFKRLIFVMDIKPVIMTRDKQNISSTYYDSVDARWERKQDDVAV